MKIGIGNLSLGNRRQGTLLNLDNVLAITIGEVEYDLAMNIDEQEYYIEMT